MNSWHHHITGNAKIQIIKNSGAAQWNTVQKLIMGKLVQSSQFLRQNLAKESVIVISGDIPLRLHVRTRLFVWKIGSYASEPISVRTEETWTGADNLIENGKIVPLHITDCSKYTLPTRTRYQKWDVRVGFQVSASRKRKTEMVQPITVLTEVTSPSSNWQQKWNFPTSRKFKPAVNTSNLV